MYRFGVGIVRTHDCGSDSHAQRAAMRADSSVEEGEEPDQSSSLLFQRAGREMNEATECGRSVEYKVNKMRVRRPGFDVGSERFAVVDEK